MPKRDRRATQEASRSQTPEESRLSKRRHDDEVHESQSPEEDDEEVVLDDLPDGQINDLDLQNIVHQILRVVLARELKGLLTRREHISTAISTNNTKTKYSYEIIMKNVKEQLEIVYGLTLKEVPKLASKAAKQPFILVNCLTEKSQDVLGEIWNLGLNINTDTKNKLHVSKIDIRNSGILLAIISLIIIHANNITELVLFKALKKLGVHTMETEKIPQFNLTITELFNELIKRDYLIRENKNEGNAERGLTTLLIFYQVGRRSLIEFDSVSLIRFVKTIYGDNFNTTVLNQVLGIIEKVYDFKVQDNLELCQYLEVLTESQCITQEGRMTPEDSEIAQE